MKRFASITLALSAALASCSAPPPRAGDRRALDAIDTVVVIYAENRAFDTLFGLFPGANGIPGVNPSAVGAYVPQVDRDGAPLATLPPTWGGLMARNQPLTVSEAQTAGLANRPFLLNGPNALGGSGVAIPVEAMTRNLVHRYYNNIMQINGGRNDGFAAWSDAGGLTMGYYDGSALAMWQVARRYTLADNFFMGAFGGSFLNHQYLVCACAPEYPDADRSPRRTSSARSRPTRAAGPSRRRAGAASSALAGAPRFVRDGDLTAEGRARHVPRRQHDAAGVSAERRGRACGQRSALRQPRRPRTRCHRQRGPTIADRLDDKGVSWAWYSGAWKAASAGTPAARDIIYKGEVRFQPHHQPFNYYASFDPATRAAYRAAHLKDFDSEFLADAAAGRLPAVSFYKPQGNLNQHPGLEHGRPRRRPHRRASSPPSRRARSGRACWSSSPTTRTAASGTTRRCRRATAGARRRAFRRSSSRRSRRRASSTRRRTTPARSCASSRGAGTSRRCRGSRMRDRALAANGEAPMGDLSRGARAAAMTATRRRRGPRRRAPRQARDVSVHGDPRSRRVLLAARSRRPAHARLPEGRERVCRRLVRAARRAQETLYQEMLSRIQQDDDSVPMRKGDWWYSTQDAARRAVPALPAPPRRRAGAALRPGRRRRDAARPQRAGARPAVPSPRPDRPVTRDARRLAYTTDLTGGRDFTLHVKDLATGAVDPWSVAEVASAAWANDGRTLYYVTMDETKRADRLWRHVMGSTGADELLYEEADELFDIGVGKTLDERFLLLGSESKDSTEWHVADADLGGDRPFAMRLVFARRADIEYDVEHRAGRFYVRINDTGRNFRLVTVDSDAPDLAKRRS
jgi:acid phosphatase